MPAGRGQGPAIRRAAVLALAAVLSGCGPGSTPDQADPSTTLGSTAATTDPVAAVQARLASAVSVSPYADALDVAPDTPVTVSTSRGRLTSVALADPAGVPVAGNASADGLSWTNAGHLSAGTTYQISGQVTDVGLSVPFQSTFTTLKAAATVHATLYPVDDDVVGVGQPVVVKFNQPVTSPEARAEVLSHLSVTESQPVPGGWYWFSAKELHFRPKDYWPTGEQITVASDLEGWNAGGSSTWGTGQVNVHFSIGPSHISTADLTTHKMVVTENGAVVATYLFSGGRETYPTMNGTHLAMTLEPVHHMVSSTVGIPVNSPDGYDEIVYSDVRISDSGEFVHAAPWSAGSQGRSNVSHGCINLSSANAKSFLDFSQLGDVIVVQGGPRAPEAGDHGVMDWSTDWSAFTPGTVSSATAPTATTGDGA